MSANPAANGGQSAVPLRLGDFRAHANPDDPDARGAETPWVEMRARGESVPLAKELGSQVIGATVNAVGTLRVRAMTVGAR